MAVSSLAARFVPSCCCLDGNRSNKLCVDVVNYVNFLDRSFEKGESDKRGINIAWRRHWSVVWAVYSCSATAPASDVELEKCPSEDS